MMQFERWSLPVIGEALLRGTSRREDFRSFLGIAPEVLDSRLDALVSAGILAREVADDGGEHFVATAKGRGLEAALRALDSWSRDWDPLSTAELLDIGDVVPNYDEPTRAVARNSAEPTPALELHLLASFDFRSEGVSVDLSPGSQRLLVLLALHDRAIARAVLAGTMWPDVSEGHAGDSLRSAIARLEAPAREAIRMTSTGLRLSPHVIVDLRIAQDLAHRLLHSAAAQPGDVGSESIATLAQGLLPDWYDDWVVAEADDWRYLRTSALEALAQRLLDAGLLGEAATASRAAIRIDPLRESPYAALVRVQLATGNRAGALETFEAYRTLLQAALGVSPTGALADMVGAIAR